MYRQERAQVGCIGIAQPFLHVIADDFRIAHDHRAIEGVIFAAFLRAILDARVENAVYALFQQIFDMPMDEFCRIACGIRRYSIHGFFKERFR